MPSMTQHERGGSGKHIWTTRLRRREEARRTAMSEEEFGDQERAAFDLDDAGITGRDNPRTFEGEDILGEPWWKDLDH